MYPASGGCESVAAGAVSQFAVRKAKRSLSYFCCLSQMPGSLIRTAAQRKQKCQVLLCQESVHASPEEQAANCKLVHAPGELPWRSQGVGQRSLPRLSLSEVSVLLQYKSGPFSLPRSRSIHPFPRLSDGDSILHVRSSKWPPCWLPFLVTV